MKTLMMMLLVLTLCGCGDIHTEEINRLKRPITVVSSTPKGGVLVRGAEGRLFLATYDTYLGDVLKNLKPGDVVSP